MEKRTKRFTVRLTPSENERLQAQAEMVGTLPAKLIRDIVIGREIASSADMAVLRELRRLGGLAKHAINEGADRAAAARAFDDLSKYARSLIRG